MNGIAYRLSWLAKVLTSTVALVLTLQSAALAYCVAKATRGVEAITIDEQMLITACEYRSDCRLNKGEQIRAQAFVAIPKIDYNIFIVDENRRCFFAREFEIDQECAGDMGVRVNDISCWYKGPPPIYEYR